MIILIASGCSQPDYVKPDISAAKQHALENAAEEVLRQHIDWLPQAEYRIQRKGRQWHVTAWRVMHPEKAGNERYVPWGHKTVVFDDQRNPIRYY